MKKEPKFWTCEEGVEVLTETEMEDAIVLWADNIVGPLPEAVTVYGFAPLELPTAERIADYVLDHIIEFLDQDFGNQVDGPDTQVTSELKGAALAFAKVLRAEYPVWACEQVEERVERVADYVSDDGMVT